MLTAMAIRMNTTTTGGEAGAVVGMADGERKGSQQDQGEADAAG